MQAIGSMLTTNRLQRPTRSIENNRTATNVSIELAEAINTESSRKPAPEAGDIPAEIDDLIDNKMYRNKFKALIRKGHLQDLLELAAMAREMATEQPPSHWFAKYTKTTPERGQEGKPTNWERTLQMLAKAREIARAAREVIKRLPVPTDGLKAVYAACWKLKGSVLQRAVTAAETAKGDSFKYFCWLVWKGKAPGMAR